MFLKSDQLRADRAQLKAFNIAVLVLFVSCLQRSKCESFSPLDDLAFDMYQDPEVAHIIRLLDQKKQDMVRQEQYEQAKNLKQAIADLQKVERELRGGPCLRW